MLEMMDHGLDDNDGVVNDNPDRQHQSEHRQRVDRKMKYRKKDERSNQRDRNREHRDDRGPDVL